MRRYTFTPPTGTNLRECCTCLDDEHPDGPPGVEEVHGVLVELVEVERVDALLGAHQDVLVVRLGVDPRRGAVDPQRATVEHLEIKKVTPVGPIMTIF